jgi:hypothetical protein
MEWICLLQNNRFLFGIIWESVKDIEIPQIPLDGKYDFLLSISSFGFVTTSSLDRVHMQCNDKFKKPVSQLSI